MGPFWRLWLCSAFLTAVLRLSSTAGSFVLTPSNQQPVEGSQLSVTCSSDVRTLFIVWYKEGIHISANNPHFTFTSSNSGSSSTLSIESVNHTMHSGQYSCVAIFSDSTKATAVFNITVKYIDANVTVQLDSGTNCSTGTNALQSGCWLRLVCLPPTGYPAVRVSWYRNEVRLRRSQPGIDFTDNKRVLSIRNTTYDDSGGYQCRANNGIGVVRYSEVINVTVQGEGRGFMIAGNGSTESVSATEGSMLSLDCSVQDAVGGVVFQWQRIKDGGTVVELEEQVGVQITSTPNASSLLLHQVKVADEGMYCCVAADFISRINKHFTVTVKVPRAIVQWPPPEVQRSEGERLQFDCVASGRPVPTIVWFFQSTPVPVAPAPTDSGLQDLGNGSILIPSLHPLHAGTYLCMLEEPPLDIHTFTLTVMPRPLSSLLPSPTVILSPATNATRAPPFTIGLFSPAVSIVLVVVCGLCPLLLCSALFISLCCCYWSWRAERHLGRAPQKQLEDAPGNQYQVSSQSYVSHGGTGEGDSEVFPGRGRRKMDLPLPPEPVPDSDGGCHYEKMEDVTLAASGVTRLRLPTFSSDSSEVAMTEVDTVVSAMTDTQLITS